MTANDHFKTLGEISYNKIIANIELHRREYFLNECNVKCVADALMMAFRWRESIEGFEYWYFQHQHIFILENGANNS